MNGTGWKDTFNPLDDKATKRLVSYGWPGNVRQLKYASEQAALVSHVRRGDRNITTDDIATVIDEREDAANAIHIQPNVSEYQRRGKFSATVSAFVRRYGNTKNQRTICAIIDRGEIETERREDRSRVIYPTIFNARLLFKDSGPEYQRCMADIMAAESKSK